VALNYVEGYARQRAAALKNFLEIAYGSLKESCYITGFAVTQKWLSEEEALGIQKLGDEIGAMLWSTISKVE
jgi:four helix bundle protein